MNDPAQQKGTKPVKKNFFEFLTESIGWIQIVVSSVLLSAMLGLIIYFLNQSTFTLVIAIAITVGGLIGGMIWATRIWKKRGTIDFVSRVSASPELDHLEEEEKSPT